MGAGHMAAREHHRHQDGADRKRRQCARVVGSHDRAANGQYQEKRTNELDKIFFIEVLYAPLA